MLQVLRVVENLRRRRGGRSRQYSVSLVYEDKSMADFVDESVENMPPDLQVWSRPIRPSVARLVIKRTA